MTSFEKEDGMDRQGYAVGPDRDADVAPTAGLEPLAKAITVIEERVDYLLHRIGPVLMPEEPMSAEVLEVRGLMSELGSQVERLRYLDRVLSRAIERIDL